MTIKKLKIARKKIDKLDNNRVKQLIKLVNEDEFGQLFISDTDYNRTKKIISEIDSSYKMFKL